MAWENKKKNIRACANCGKIYKWCHSELCKECRVLNDIKKIGRKGNEVPGEDASNSTS